MTPPIPTKLFEGYRDFRTMRYGAEADRFRTLAEGQSPNVMVIGCADSRVDPATIFSAAPGELFVVRNVAALVPPYEEAGVYHGTSAALEFAVTRLRVQNIVVLGHGMCGGITAALTAAEDRTVGQFIGPWVNQLSGVRETLLEQETDIAPEGRQNALEHLSIKYSLDNLRGFPFVEAAIKRKELALHGAWFSIAEGELHWLDHETGAFGAVAVS
ncbi:MAG: carbonic anhydrase [Hyphomicrobiales bacterium]